MSDDNQTVQVSEDKLEQLVERKVKERLQEQRQANSLSPGRRGFLGALAAAAGLGAAGHSFIQPAAAQSSAAGQIGSPSQLVDIYAYRIGDSNNPVQEVYIDQQFVSASQQSLSVDDVSDNGSGAVTFLSPLSASTAEVSSTFTDPAGTSHSGELADAADVVSDHSNLSNVTSDQHHAQVHGNSDHTATFAVDGDAQPPENHGNSAHSPDMIEDATSTGNAPHEIQKNGTDGAGIINFKT